MNINARFEEIINSLYKGNKRAFAQSVGISATVVENVVGTRKGKPSYDVLEKVCANANISAEWLLTGKGEMQRAEDRQLAIPAIKEQFSRLECRASRCMNSTLPLDWWPSSMERPDRFRSAICKFPICRHATGHYMFAETLCIRF